MSMSKVACETAAALTDPDAGAGGGAVSDSPSRRADDADEPPVSVLLRVPDGVGVTHHLFGAALRRDGSTKGSSNPKAAAEAAATRKGAPRAADSRRPPATNTMASSSSSSSSKTAVVIGVLPAGKVVVATERRRARPGRVVVAARAWRRPAAGARVFASEAGVVGPEPVSPKVSCFGAVLSEERSGAAPPAQGEEEGSCRGCWTSLRTALLGPRRDNSDRSVNEPGSSKATALEPQPQRVAVMSPPRPVAPPGLGDVKRLASRRWPETMARGTV